MRDYQSGKWGFALIWGLRASVFPQAFCLALPNAICAFLFSFIMEKYVAEPGEHEENIADNALKLWAGFTSVLFFVLYFRSNVAYSRWWEGGTLLQKTRGEWFNAYSSLIAFSSTDPKRESEVEEFHHMLARFMSLLFSAALQQVSPDKNRPFEIISSQGIDPKSLEFLNRSSDKVEVILQWIQRSTILNMGTGVLQSPPPVMSRAFQEISRGIVNLQNARKIAEFPFPFPYAQTSIVMLLMHWCMCPLVSTMMLEKFTAAATCFAIVFFLWCINYIALYLEQPFGSRSNDLPMSEMQADWNKSIGTLLAKRAQQPPTFTFEPEKHRRLELSYPNGTSGDPEFTRLPDIPTDFFEESSEPQHEGTSLFRRLSIQMMGQWGHITGKRSSTGSASTSSRSAAGRLRKTGSKNSTSSPQGGFEPGSSRPSSSGRSGDRGGGVLPSSTQSTLGEASWASCPISAADNCSVRMEGDPNWIDGVSSWTQASSSNSASKSTASQTAAQRLKAIASSCSRAKAGPLQPRSSSSGPASGAEVRRAASNQQSPQPSSPDEDAEAVSDSNIRPRCKPNQWPEHAVPSALSVMATESEQLAPVQLEGRAGQEAAAFHEASS